MAEKAVGCARPTGAAVGKAPEPEATEQKVNEEKDYRKSWYQGP